MSIVSSGQLVMCKACRKHAHLVLSNGIRTPEFAFKRDGCNILSVAATRYDLSLLESGYLREQIQNGDLPDEHLQVSGYLLFAVEVWNIEWALMPEEAQNFHRVLRDAKRWPLPAGFLEIMDRHMEVGIHPENIQAKRYH